VALPLSRSEPVPRPRINHYPPYLPLVDGVPVPGSYQLYPDWDKPVLVSYQLYPDRDKPILVLRKGRPHMTILDRYSWPWGP